MHTQRCAVTGLGRRFAAHEPSIRHGCRRVGTIQATAEDGSEVLVCERHARLSLAGYVWVGRPQRRLTAVGAEVGR